MFIPELMGYPDYLLEARKRYKGNRPSLDYFYNVGAFQVGDKVIQNAEYLNAITELSATANAYFNRQKTKPDDLAINFPNPVNVPAIHKISNILVPFLEENLYGCHLFVDKLYVYRNVSASVRKSSWIWHFDNNPREVFKNMIYLTNVDTVNNAPFEYMVGPDGNGIVAMPTRMGVDYWHKAKNNSRISDATISSCLKKGAKKIQILGKRGTITAFNNDVIHRANIPKTGYRDVLVVRVRPTLEKMPYVNPKWSTSFEVSGVVPKNPNDKK